MTLWKAFYSAKVTRDTIEEKQLRIEIVIKCFKVLINNLCMRRLDKLVNGGLGLSSRQFKLLMIDLSSFFLNYFLVLLLLVFRFFYSGLKTYKY